MRRTLSNCAARPTSELPDWHPYPAGITEGGEAFTVDDPLSPIASASPGKGK